jgi:cytochrome c2
VIFERRHRTILVAAALGLAAASVDGTTAGQTAPSTDRGRAVFEASGCARCHLPQAAKGGIGPPLETIRRPQGAFEVAGRLWNHAPRMFAAFEKEGVRWPRMTSEQMTDLMVYLQAEPARDTSADLLQGQLILVRKGCLKCHRLRNEGGTVAMDLAQYHGGYASPPVWAATIWNHAPRMAEHAERLSVLYPRFVGDEMANLVAFLRSVAGPSK